MTHQKTVANTGSPLKTPRELASMLSRLPREERLRVEGIIVGMELARTQSPTDAPGS